VLDGRYPTTAHESTADLRYCRGRSGLGELLLVAGDMLRDKLTIQRVWNAKHVDELPLLTLQAGAGEAEQFSADEPAQDDQHRRDHVQCSVRQLVSIGCTGECGVVNLAEEEGLRATPESNVRRIDRMADHGAGRGDPECRHQDAGDELGVGVESGECGLGVS
jgi:hypothetical protein